jgi:hypothetical protein
VVSLKPVSDRGKLETHFMDTEPNITQSPERRQTLAEKVGEELARQTFEREQERADHLVMTDDSEIKHDPSNPGRSFAQRIFKRLAEQS